MILRAAILNSNNIGILDINHDNGLYISYDLKIFERVFFKLIRITKNNLK